MTFNYDANSFKATYVLVLLIQDRLDHLVFSSAIVEIVFAAFIAFLVFLTFFIFFVRPAAFGKRLQNGNVGGEYVCRKEWESRW